MRECVAGYQVGEVLPQDTTEFTLLGVSFLTVRADIGEGRLLRTEGARASRVRVFAGQAVSEGDLKPHDP